MNVAYIRVSTSGQREGFGLDVQESAVRAYASSHGVHLGRMVTETASGAALPRPGLSDALGSLTPGSVLLVPRLDRLARDLIAQELVLREVAARGASVASCSPGEADILRGDDPTRRLIRQVLGAVAEYERALIQIRLSAGRAAKKARGGYSTGGPPYGWQAQAGELVPNDHEQDALRAMRELQSSGVAFRRMDRELRRMGFAPRRAARWSPQVLSAILRRSAVRDGLA